jgi:hypothetical protein
MHQVSGRRGIEIPETRHLKPETISSTATERFVFAFAPPQCSMPGLDGR